MFVATVVIALREIRRNGLRSLLTMLGIVIGVASVIALVAIGRGATARVKDDIAKLGKNLLMLNPGTYSRGVANSGVAFKVEDAQAIQRDVAGVKAVAPSVTTSVQAILGSANARVSVTGADDAFFAVRNYTLQSGRLFNHVEVQSGHAVCVLGGNMKATLFAGRDPVGASLRVGPLSCKVIGLLASKGQAAAGQDQDDIIVMPLNAVQRRLTGNDYVSLIYVSAEEGRDTARIATRITALMRQRRHRLPGMEDDFTIRDMAEVAQVVGGVTAALTALLGAIAAVSLVVGGIGIMNIMLVSVTERTREIGIRLAIGAFAGEVMLQFLLEAVVLSTLGGMIGIGAGVASSFVAARGLRLPFVLAPDMVLLAFVFSALVGVLFGYLPARKAARLQPIEALRHE